MIKAKTGSIVNIASSWPKKEYPLCLHMEPPKLDLINFSRAAAVEAAPYVERTLLFLELC